MLLDVGALDRRIVKVIEVIDDCDSPVAFGHQTIDEVRADESRAASDENVTHFGVRRLDGALSLLLWCGAMNYKAASSRRTPNLLRRIDPQVPAPT